MAAVRTATVTWQGPLATGEGTVTAGTSGLFTDLPISWGSRTEQPAGRTSPEELLAASHAACFAMAFSADLGRAGFTPDELHVEAEVTFDKLEGGWTVTTSAITVLGRVPGISADEFDRIAEGTKDGCPISRALAGNVAMTVEATLESDA
jgi:osmotically inducible protein OsmC